MLSRLRSRLSRMTPRAITEWNAKRIGAVSLLLVAVIVGGALALTSNVFASTYTVNARFANAVGLSPGAEVLMAGVQVGKVGNVSAVGNHVVAQLDINDGVQIPDDSTADISVETLLGVIGVNVNPGGDWSHLLRNGSVITNTGVPYEFFQVRNIAGSQLSQTNATALGNVVTDLSKATSGDKSQIQQLIRGLAELTGTVDAHRVQASQLIDAAKELSAVLASKDTQLGTVVDDLDKVVNGLASRSSELGTLIDATEQAATQTSSLIGRNQPRLQQMLTDLHAALQVIGAHQLDIARSVAFAASAIQGFSSIGQSGNTMPDWANIYTNIVGASVGYEVLGNCGALDEALDVALGPDPKPCAQRSGPIPNSGAGSTSAPPTSGLSSLFAPFTKGAAS
jgi:phospholipid/cholesterol/gamma-HCH transport system substrate-binding protein